MNNKGIFGKRVTYTIKFLKNRKVKIILFQEAEKSHYTYDENKNNILGVDINTSSKYMINDTRINPPIKPKLETNTENIKSVCISGKYSGVLLKPCPNNPPDPIAVNPLVNCNPLELDQFSILSIR